VIRVCARDWSGIDGTIASMNPYLVAVRYGGLARIGLARGKRAVEVIAYRLFHSPAKTCVTQWQTTLTVNALHFSTLRISAFSNADPICLSWKMIHEPQTEIYGLRYCKVALLKALTTYNLHSATKMYKNYTDQNMSFAHKHTNN